MRIQSLLIYILIITQQVNAEPWKDISTEENRAAGSVVRIDENIEKQPDGTLLVKYETGGNRLSLKIPHKIKVNCSKKSIVYQGSFDLRNSSEAVKINIHRDISTVYKEVCLK
ncbi:hypothetical protein BEN71_11215 [Acinetobacter wuhouensis]|uniref:hypothetical protein n=1 Tax=Acinetobacter wuhouensis TaxID=1879050 RepID=UPI00083AA90B|nr:hypothetical protein [Acinetobacter wuhouensis]AXQ22607.1 hypothetical protein BEN71_11215 [Acinetobacter wuhouensis]